MADFLRYFLLPFLQFVVKYFAAAKCVCGVESNIWPLFLPLFVAIT
jgi:hypothetical protein